jgi:putative two-component system response regulator
MTTDALGHILLVDDDSYVLDSVSAFLREYGFEVTAVSRGRDALGYLVQKHADIVLTDINMPEMDGLGLLEQIRRINRETPVVLMTAYADLDTAVQAIQKGAHDFIIKPYKPQYLIHTLEKGIQYRKLRQLERNYRQELEQKVDQRTMELHDALKMVTSMSRELISRLTAATELRDEDTGRHLARIGLYTRALALQMGMDEGRVETLRLASTMHDVGKIGVPDAILLKPGKLTPEEFEVIKGHTLIGEKILKGSSHLLLQVAASIAVSHHERWDGSGYPNGLRGEMIPIEGRIVMLVDQYDALRSVRVYKPALSHSEVMRVICEGDGRTMPGHFDPNVLAAFRATEAEFDDIFQLNQG